MNKARLRLLADHLRKTPYDLYAEESEYDYGPQLITEKVDYFNMEDYFGATEDRCGTVGCIAGHAVGLFGDVGNRAIPVYSIPSEAGRLLELTSEEASALFCPSDWLDLSEVEPHTAAAVLDDVADGEGIREAWIANVGS